MKGVGCTRVGHSQRDRSGPAQAFPSRSLAEHSTPPPESRSALAGCAHSDRGTGAIPPVRASMGPADVYKRSGKTNTGPILRCTREMLGLFDFAQSKGGNYCPMQHQLAVDCAMYVESRQTPRLVTVSPSDIPEVTENMRRAE